MAHRVLVVEDNPTLGLVIQDNLTSEGYEVNVAPNGACAIRHTQTATPDIIILDLTLPDCDGLDLLPILRLRGQVPIIILTARAQQPEKLSGLRLGADDYITKPFDMEELLARIRAVLRRARPSVVDFAIARLRKKIEVDRHHPKFIRTAHGDGYCLSGVSDEEVTKPKGKLCH